jgi:hypothetical protein
VIPQPLERITVGSVRMVAAGVNDSQTNLAVEYIYYPPLIHFFALGFQVFSMILDTFFNPAPRLQHGCPSAAAGAKFFLPPDDPWSDGRPAVSIIKCNRLIFDIFQLNRDLIFNLETRYIDFSFPGMVPKNILAFF